jgi:hypothetical protein
MTCLLTQCIEEYMERVRRRGWRRKELLDDLKEKRRYGNWKRNQRIGLSRELALEGAMKLSQDRLHNEVYEGVCVCVCVCVGGGGGAGMFWVHYP